MSEDISRKTELETGQTIGDEPMTTVDAKKITPKLVTGENTDAVPAAASQLAAPDPFRPDNLRLSQSFTETMPVKKLLTVVPVRKPGPQDWVRVRPGTEFRENFPIIEIKDEREEYIVTSQLVPELVGEVVSKTLFMAINRQGTVFLWPCRLPTPDGKDLDWWRSLRGAAEVATKSWVRVKANMNLGAYDIFQAENTLSDPEWPELDFWDLIKIAFRDHLIDRIDHPVIDRLRGKI
jgi:hypothetical protein